MSRPMWRRVRRQVEELLVAAEDDLDLLDRGAVALEPVVDAAADEPAAELGERPVERGAGRRSSRDAMLERDRVRPELLDAGHLEPRVLAEDDLGACR